MGVKKEIARIAVREGGEDERRGRRKEGRKD